MKDTFKLIAQAAFEDAVAKADEDKTTTFNKATDSLAKAMKDYTENMNQIEAKSLERGTRLEERINTVSQLGLKLSEETGNLTRALKADSQAQGMVKSYSKIYYNHWVYKGNRLSNTDQFYPRRWYKTTN